MIVGRLVAVHREGKGRGEDPCEGHEKDDALGDEKSVCGGGGGWRRQKETCDQKAGDDGPGSADLDEILPMNFALLH